MSQPRSDAQCDSAAGFAALLHSELVRQGFFGSQREYDTARVAITATGRRLWDSTAAAIGRRQWDREVRRRGIVVCDDDCARMFGLGFALTDLMVAGLNAAPEDRRAVGELGALANFIVAVYDGILDADRPAANALPLSALNGVLGRGPAERLPWRRADARGARLLRRLTCRYVEHLDGIRPASPRPWVRPLIEETIVQMYLAEHVLVDDRLTAPTSALRRKSALPFVVMGLPAWLVTPDATREALRRHIRLLYRTGLFVGWVDDAVDAADDRLGRQPNLVNRACARDATPEGRRALARDIAAQGQRIRDEWLLGSERRAAQPPADALSLAVLSWFGDRLDPALT